jgi:imidazolonepropionase-like amidohydrolase
MRIVQTLFAPALCALLLCVLQPRQATAQLNEPPPPAAYALTGVTIVSADGAARANVTIVVRRGFIEAIGSDVQIPPDAELLEGDSLVVYSGMIDAHGKASVEFPEAEVERSELAFWAPPREAQGLTPHRRAADYLTDTGDDFEKQRSSGIVAEGIIPDGPLMPGRGVVLLLRRGATAPAGLVLVPELGPSMALQGARGMYPSTVFGAAAVIRQSFEDARHHGLLLAAHERDPSGMKAPAWDPDWEVLRAAMAGQARVFFNADRASDIRTVLAMAAEYEFRPVIVGGSEAWKVADELRAGAVPVLVSLDFPEPDRWEPKEPSDTAQQEPLDAAAAREKQNLEERYANAARLAQAGVTFALTSGGGEADLIAGARKSIEYGLSEDQALASLTTDRRSSVRRGHQGPVHLRGG